MKYRNFIIAALVIAILVLGAALVSRPKRTVYQPTSTGSSTNSSTNNSNTHATSTTDGSTTRMRTVELYFYNPAIDQGPGGVQCTENGLVAVTRDIPITITPIQDTIKLLLRGGLLPIETEHGLTTEFPLSGVTLKGANLVGGVLTLEFTDPEHKTSGGSCRTSLLWKEIESTAKQFPEVKSVRYIPADLFQP